MDEEFESFVVTDPDLVDEGIDVSGLRTQTDTSLLGNIPDFAGIQYEAFNPNRLSDLMRLYSSGLPTRSVSQPTTPPATGGGGSGGGGQATLPSFDVDAPKNTAEQQRLIDAGIGVQAAPGQPVVAPGEMPVTQEEIDNFNFPALTQENTADDIMKDFQYQSLKEDLSGRNLVDEVALTGGEQSTIQNIIGKAGQTVEGALTELGKIPGAIVDAANKTVDIFGKKLNVGKTLAGLAVNKLVGGPATLVFDLLKDVIPERDPRQNELDRFYDVENNKIQSGLMAGYNPVSGGGLYTLTGGRAGEEPTYGLQEAYDKRINTIENTLATKYPDGDYSDTQLDERLAELKDLKAREKDVLDAAETGAPQENIGAIDSIYSAPDTIVGPNIDEDPDRFGGGADIPSGPITTDITSDQIDEFGTAPTAKGPPGQLNPANPSDRGTIIEKAQELGVGNIDKHIENNSKLRQAQQAGIISNEDYNILGGYDVTQNITGGSTTASAALNAIVGTGRNVAEAIKGEQDFGIIPGTTVRNTQGALGLISQDQKNIHNAIVNGNLDTPEGIAAVKNQIEMSQFRDPIMDMVAPTPDNILAGPDDAFDYFGDVDISQDAPVETFDADIFDDFDDGTMTGSAADSMDDVLGPMPGIPTPRVPDFISGGREDKPTGPPSTGFKAPTKQGQSPRGSTTGGGGGRDSCFLPDTLVTMADGSTKKIIDVDIGDEVAEGGKVFATGKFLNNELYDYKGIKVSGSHMVNEDGVWMRIRDTKHGKPLGDDEHTVYVFGSENRRILINNILFTDYFEIKEQEKLIDNEKDFFNNWKTYGNKIDQDNINILNAS
jgi:hypothetical protein